MIRQFIKWMCLIVGLTMFIVTMAFRFNHPHMTQTELFLRQWPYYLGTAVCMWYYYKLSTA